MKPSASATSAEDILTKQHLKHGSAMRCIIANE